jgi:hypothetical protein
MYQVLEAEFLCADKSRLGAAEKGGQHQTDQKQNQI